MVVDGMLQNVDIFGKSKDVCDEDKGFDCVAVLYEKFYGGGNQGFKTGGWRTVGGGWTIWNMGIRS